MAQPRILGRFATRPVALAAVGLALVACGLLLVQLAFSGAVFGRLVTRAWVAGVAGLVLVLPGAAVVLHGFWLAFSAPRDRREGKPGPDE